MRFDFIVNLKIKNIINVRSEEGYRWKENLTLPVYPNTNRKSQKIRRHATNIDLGQQRRKRKESEEAGGYKKPQFPYSKRHPPILSLSFFSLRSFIWEIFYQLNTLLDLLSFSFFFFSGSLCF